MTKTEIIPATQAIFNAFSVTCSSMDTAPFFERPDGKWSVAENMQHLIISTNTSTLAYALPKFLVRWIGGRPNRGSRTYEEILAKYNRRLEEGGKASSRFVPKPIEVKYGKEKLIGNWKKVTEKFIAALKNRRTENDLDNYLVKHPLLGRITLRELCYFTIFHTEHHLQGIKKRMMA